MIPTSSYKKHQFIQQYLPIFIAIIVIGVFSYASWFAYQYEIEIEKKKVADELSLIANRIETTLNEQLNKAYGLAAYKVEHPDSSLDQLTAFSDHLFSSYLDMLKSVTLTDDTKVSFIYPANSNTLTLGTDLSQVENQKEAVLRAKLTRRILISQPVELPQGETVIYCHMPMMNYVNGIPQNFKGLMTVAVNYDRLLGNSGLLKSTQKYAINIYDTNESYDSSMSRFKIFSSQNSPIINPIELPIILQESSWAIEAAPINGWQTTSVLPQAIIFTGLIAALLVFFYLRLMFRSHTELNALVDQRTTELSDTNLYLEESLASLEEKQAELELLNDKIEFSLEELRLTQEQLIQSEKLAALGELVAGVAHEINTPLGVGITLTSFLKEKIELLNTLYDENHLTKTELADYLRSSTEAIGVMDSSLNRAAEIVTSFKTVAVEQATLEVHSFNLKQYIEDVLLNLKPKLKTTQHSIRLVCEEGLEVVSYPGAISHILTNLIVNTLIHGFDGIEAGRISIIVEKTESTLHLIYSDDGLGIPKELQSKVFNPFFTTQRVKGGTGLGLHIVHNMVTQVLGGRIQLSSSPGNGVEFSIYFPDLKSENIEKSKRT